MRPPPKPETLRLDTVVDDVTVAESGGTATFTVTLGSAATAPVSVNYATFDGTAAQHGTFHVGRVQHARQARVRGRFAQAFVQNLSADASLGSTRVRADSAGELAPLAGASPDTMAKSVATGSNIRRRASSRYSPIHSL